MQCFESEFSAREGCVQGTESTAAVKRDTTIASSLQSLLTAHGWRMAWVRGNCWNYHDNIRQAEGSGGAHDGSEAQVNRTTGRRRGLKAHKVGFCACRLGRGSCEDCHAKESASKGRQLCA